MARLFGREYHEHSNSWYYKNSVYKLSKEEVSYKKYLDEQNNVILEFVTVRDKAKIFPLNLKICYKPGSQQR
jgi:hypothetical protein